MHHKLIKNRIRNITYTTLSEAWATLSRIDYEFLFKDGTWKHLSRESYNRGNGTSILLFNKEKGTVLLTKQFRMPAYENDIKDGMSIEVCAGALDKDESPENCIIREVEEEVGYRIKKVEKVMEAYMSPGAVTEKMYMFIGEYSDSIKVSDGGGVVEENEEIEVLELSFSQALSMIYNFEIKDSKTIMLLQYAKINNLL